MVFSHQVNVENVVKSYKKTLLNVIVVIKLIN